MLALREHRHLVKIFGEPGGGLGNVDKTVQTHGFVASRLVAGDAMTAISDQLLDQLRARGLVLDQHDSRTEQPLLLAHGPPAIERRPTPPCVPPPLGDSRTRSPSGG